VKEARQRISAAQKRRWRRWREIYYTPRFARRLFGMPLDHPSYEDER
jgi:hypothetical protein